MKKSKSFLDQKKAIDLMIEALAEEEYERARKARRRWYQLMASAAALAVVGYAIWVLAGR